MTTTTPSRNEHRLTTTQARILWLASLGGALEFYDFVIFVFFTAVIGKLFFPASTADWIRQIQTYGIFAVGYLARPLGGIVLAHYGDILGRKRIFTLSILLMAIPTLLIGFVPTYRQIGVAAPLILVLLRVLQGIAIGGEAPGGWVFVAEHAPERHRGFAIGLLTGGLSLGILLGSLVATGINSLFTPAEVAARYWRLPFLIGGVFGFGALLLRRQLTETPVFETIRRQAAATKEIPVRQVLRHHAAAVVASVVATWTLTAVIVVEILMTPTLLQKLYHLSPLATQKANLAATAALCVSTALVGALVDRFGVRKVAAPAVVFLILTSYALYALGGRGSNLLPVYFVAGLAAGLVSLTPIVMVRAFPPLVRFSGVSLSYNLAYAVFGGLTPPLVSWFAHLNPIGPAYYVATAAVFGLAAFLFAPVAGDV